MSLSESAVLFNALKHHAGYIKGKLEALKTVEAFNDLVLEVQSLNNNLIDLYTGDRHVAGIIRDVLGWLSEKGLNHEASYKAWIQDAGQEYRMIRLPDDSMWTLRIGKGNKHFVHIHPSRHSLHTFRIRGMTLKTSILLFGWCKLFRQTPFERDNVNRVRAKYLGVSPVKSLNRDKGLGKMIRYFYEQVPLQG